MPPKTTPIHVPFNAGVREDIDPKLLPDGLFARLENARYRKDGSLGLRNGYTSLSMLTKDARSLVPYDVASYRDRLVVLGNELDEGFPTALYEYTGITGIGWRTLGDPSAHILDPFTDAKNLAAPPQMSGGLLTLSVAASQGYTMVAYSAADSPDTVFVNVVRESDGQIVLSSFDTTTNRGVTVLATQNGSGGECFIYVGYDSVSSRVVRAKRFDPNSDTAFVSLGTIENIAADITAIAAAPVSGTNQFVIAVDRTFADLLVKRFNTSGAQQGSTISLASTTPERLALEAATTSSGTINLLHLDGATLSLYTWTFAGVLTGPTSLTTACDTGAANKPTIARLPADAALSWAESIVAAWGEVPGGGLIAMNLRINARTIAAHTQVMNLTRNDFALTTQIVALPTEAQAAVVAIGGTVRDGASLGGSASNALMYVCGSSGLATHLCVQDQLLGVHGAGALARDVYTGRLFWGRQVVNINDEGMLAVLSLAVQSSERRQVVEQNGDLFFASATPQTWNGDVLGEVAFQELPGIRGAVASNGAGALAVSASYDYVATWTWLDGRSQIVRSAPSLPVTVATTASDDTVTLQVSLPHQIRVGLGFTSVPTGITVTVWRSVWDGAAKITGFRKAATETVTLTLGGTVQIVDTVSDAALLSQELLYTDAGSGALSGPIQRLSPRSARYLAPSADALIAAGNPDASQFQQSLPVSVGEAVTFCPFGDVGVSFFGVCQRPVTGLAVTNGARIFFHSDGISVATGAGPTADGQGEQPVPQLVPTNFGLRANGWRSLLVTGEGLWFQADDEKLCVMPLGGGTPEWAGQALRSTLAIHKDIAAATLAADDNIAAFAANTGVGSGCLLIRDQRTGDWCVDKIPGNPPVRSLTHQLGKLVYITSSTLRRQSDAFDDESGALIPLLAETGDTTAFGVAGWGKIACLTLLAEFRGNCKVRGSVSFDGGLTYALVKEYTLQDLSYGSPLELQFWPRRRKCARFRWLFEAVDLDGASEGVVLSGATLHVRPSGGPTKTASNRRG